jgi:hypothetical protein
MDIKKFPKKNYADIVQKILEVIEIQAAGIETDLVIAVSGVSGTADEAISSLVHSKVPLVFPCVVLVL